MKRFCILTLTVLLILVLVACAKQETSYTANIHGIEYQVDTVEKTISDGINIYQYTFSGDSAAFNVTITYPDGSSYWYTQSEGMGQGGWSNDYNEDAYVSGDTLVELVQTIAPKRVSPGNTVAAFLLIALGIFDVVFPKASWYLGYGWRYKNAEPSDAALIFSRIGGAVVIIVGIMLMLY